jgi:hypothetical protein
MRDAHPLADVFPLMEDDSQEFEELIKDIEANGQLLPIVMLEGKILDGRNRARAIDKINEGRQVSDRMPHTEIKFETKYPDGDPVSYVWAINAVRRQLTPGQRDMAAQALESLGWGGNRKATADVPTREKIAKKTGASVKGMERAARVRKDAIPEVAKAVETGALALNTADRISRLPEGDQEEVMASPKPVDAVARKESAGAARPKKTARPPSPAAQMRAHMTGHQSGIRDVQLIGKFWEENRENVSGLAPEELKVFIRDLEESRAATVRLLHVIEEEILPVWPLPGKKPALLSSALRRVDEAKNENTV